MTEEENIKYNIQLDKKFKENNVELIEIWMPTEKGGEAYNYKTKQNLKRIALLANGKVIYLEKDFALEKSWITKQEANLKFN